MQITSRNKLISDSSSCSKNLLNIIISFILLKEGKKATVSYTSKEKQENEYKLTIYKAKKHSYRKNLDLNY